MLKIGNIVYVSRAESERDYFIPLETNRKVFVSYDHRNEDLSCIRDVAVKKSIHLFDITLCFHEEVLEGEQDLNEITNTIAQCDTMLLLLTDNISSYDALWDYEVKTALKMKKRIIPVSFNISQSEYKTVSDMLNNRMPILDWPVLGESNGIELVDLEKNSGNMIFDDAFERALRYFVSDRNLAQKSETAISQITADVDLTIEQKFYVGYAYLHGIGVLADEVKGVKLLDEVARFYNSDKHPDEQMTFITTVAAKDRGYLALSGKKGEDTMSCTAISVRGKVRELGSDMLPLLFQNNPYMFEIYPTEESRKALTVFQIYEGSGEWFDLSKKPIERDSFTFGGAEIRASGYFVTDDCIGCGSCLSDCPQSCIELKEKALIRQENCLHCGNCAEVCPVGAVIRR